MLSRENQAICRSFAEILDYPGQSLPAKVQGFLDQLERSSPRPARPLRRFAQYLAGKPASTLEELYAQTFDLTAANSLYLGYHLFGETPKRSAFMVQLQEAYQGLGFSSGGELPDHLCVLLRFLSVAKNPEFCRPLLQECILPGLSKTEAELLKADNPYGWLVQALRTFLERAEGKQEKAGGESRA